MKLEVILNEDRQSAYLCRVVAGRQENLEIARTLQPGERLSLSHSFEADSVDEANAIMVKWVDEELVPSRGEWIGWLLR